MRLSIRLTWLELFSKRMSGEDVDVAAAKTSAKEARSGVGVAKAALRVSSWPKKKSKVEAQLGVMTAGSTKTAHRLQNAHDELVDQKGGIQSFPSRGTFLCFSSHGKPTPRVNAPTVPRYGHPRPHGVLARCVGGRRGGLARRVAHVA